jgi:hypothetical protein
VDGPRPLNYSTPPTKHRWSVLWAIVTAGSIILALFAATQVLAWIDVATNAPTPGGPVFCALFYVGAICAIFVVRHRILKNADK